MRSFEEFQEYIADNLPLLLGSNHEAVSVTRKSFMKNNGVQHHGMLVQIGESNVSPVVYMENYFERYENGESEEMLLSEISDVVRSNINVPSEIANVTAELKQFDCVKDKIIAVAVNVEKNRELLSDMPWVEKEDLALTFKILLESETKGLSTIPIKKDLMHVWGVETDSLYDIALKNTQEKLPARIVTLESAMRDAFEKNGMSNNVSEEMLSETDLLNQLYVISNAKGVNGATVMFYENVLSQIAEKMGTDLYVLPSSVHECIVLSKEMGEPDILAGIVKSVNRSAVSSEEQLSDHVYQYNARSRRLTIVDAQEIMQEQNEKQIESQSRPHRHR